MTNQSDKQASIRSATGTQLNYEGDWHALWDLRGIPAGAFEGRMLTYLNTALGATYGNVNSAMAAFAILNGVANWNSLGSFTPP